MLKKNILKRQKNKVWQEKYKYQNYIELNIKS